MARTRPVLLIHWVSEQPLQDLIVLAAIKSRWKNSTGYLKNQNQQNPTKLRALPQCSPCSREQLHYICSAQDRIVTKSPTQGPHFEMLLSLSCDYLRFKKIIQTLFSHNCTIIIAEHSFPSSSKKKKKKNILDNFTTSKSHGSQTSLLVAILPISFTSL